MGEHNEAQLSGPVQNTQCADVVKIHVLVDGVELDALQTQLLYPGQLGAVVVVIRMDTAEGEDPGLRKLFIDACGTVIDVQHLLRAGGHRKDHRIIYPGFGHGSHQAAVGAVHIGFCVGHLLQLGNSGGGQLVRERMGVDINDHNINSFFAGKPRMILSQRRKAGRMISSIGYHTALTLNMVFLAQEMEFLAQILRENKDYSRSPSA